MINIKKEEKIKLYDFIKTYKKIYADIESVTNELELINKKKDILLNELTETRNKEVEFINFLKEKYDITEKDIKNIIN